MGEVIYVVLVKVNYFYLYSGDKVEIVFEYYMDKVNCLLLFVGKF